MSTARQRIVFASAVNDVNCSQTWRYARSLANAGHEVVLVMPGVIRSPADYESIRHIPLNAPARHFWYGAGLCNAIGALQGRVHRSVVMARVLRDVRPDVLVTAEPDAWAVGVDLRRRTALRLVEDLREVYEDRAHAFPGVIRPLVAKGVQVAFRFLARHTDEIIHVSPERAAVYAYLGRTGVLAFPFPELHTAPTTARLTHGRATFLHAGPLRKNYAGVQLLAALRVLASEGDDWRVVVLGGVADDMATNDDLETLKSSGRLVVCGPVSRDEVAQWLDVSHVGINLVLPVDTLHRLAQPRKLYEYMGAGLPVLGSNVPTIARVLRSAGCGVAVDAAQPTGIAAGVRELLSRRAEWPSMGLRGFESARDNYNWTAVEPKFRRAVVPNPLPGNS